MKLLLPFALCWILACPEVSSPAAVPHKPTAQAKRRHKRKRIPRKVVVQQPSEATPADLAQLIKAFSDDEIRAELARRTLPHYPAPLLEAEAEKRKLSDFTNKEIRAELNRRLLMAYRLTELQREAEKRGIQ